MTDFNKKNIVKKYETELYEYQNAFIAGNCNFATNIIDPVMEHASEIANSIQDMSDTLNQAIAHIKQLEARDAEEERLRRIQEQRRKGAVLN